MKKSELRKLLETVKKFLIKQEKERELIEKSRIKRLLKKTINIETLIEYLGNIDNDFTDKDEELIINKTLSLLKDKFSSERIYLCPKQDDIKTLSVLMDWHNMSTHYVIMDFLETQIKKNLTKITIKNINFLIKKLSILYFNLKQLFENRISELIKENEKTDFANIRIKELLDQIPVEKMELIPDWFIDWIKFPEKIPDNPVYIKEQVEKIAIRIINIHKHI